MSHSKASERLFMDTIHTDVVFVGENFEIHGHRAAFATSCRYFEILLYGDFKESKSDKVEITETSSKVFIEVKRFIYLGQLKTEDWTIEELLGLLSVAHEYQYHELFAEVINVLEKQPLDFNSWSLVNSAAALYNSTSLKVKCASFAEAEVDSFLRLENMEKMTDEFIRVMFDTPKIRTVNQDQLINSLLQWKKTHSSSQIRSVLQKISWTKVSPNIAASIAKLLLLNLRSEDEIPFCNQLCDEIQVQSQWILQKDNVVVERRFGDRFILEKHEYSCNMFIQMYPKHIQISFYESRMQTEFLLKGIEFELSNEYRIQKLVGMRASLEYQEMDYKIVVGAKDNCLKYCVTYSEAEPQYLFKIYSEDFAKASEITLRSLLIY